MKNMTKEDHDQLDRIINKFMTLPAEKQKKLLEEADKILKEGDQ